MWPIERTDGRTDHRLMISQSQPASQQTIVWHKLSALLHQSHRATEQQKQHSHGIVICCLTTNANNNWWWTKSTTTNKHFRVSDIGRQHFKSLQKIFTRIVVVVAVTFLAVCLYFLPFVFITSYLMIADCHGGLMLSFAGLFFANWQNPR